VADSCGAVLQPLTATAIKITASIFAQIGFMIVHPV
jgi:hypothetical protein